MRRDELTRVVRIAEEAASAVGDPTLRAVAFDRILQYFLHSGTSTDFAVSHPIKAARHESPGPIADTTRAPRDSGPTAWVESLRLEKFFSQPRTIGDVVESVRALGHNIQSKDVTFPLTRLVQLHKLRRVRKASASGDRGQWIYTDY